MFPRTRRIAVLGGEKAYWQRLKGIQPSNLIGLWRQNQVPAGNNYLTFNGTNTSISFGSAASLDDLPSAADMTVDGWVYINQDVDQSVIMGKSDSGITTSGWAVYPTGAGTIRIYVNYATSDCATTAAFSTGAWVHVAGFIDQSASKCRVAINGTWGTLSSAGSGAYSSDGANNLSTGVIGSGRPNMLMGWFRVSNSDRYDGTNGVAFTPPSRTTIPTVDANTVSLWPMDEGYGSVAGDIGTNNNDGTISNGDWGAYPALTDSSPELNHGTYVGVNLANTEGPDGIAVPFYDGVNDYGDPYSAGFSSDFGYTAGTILIWGKVFNSGVWSDSTTRRLIHLQVNASNRIYILKNAAAGRIDWLRQAGGTSKLVSKTSVSTTSWFLVGITWSESADQVIAYYNGIQEGSTLTSVGTWAGTFSANQIGIGGVPSTPSDPWYGWIGPVAVWKTPLTAAEILKASTI